MVGKTHKAGGMLTGIAISSYLGLDIVHTAVITSVSVLGSLVPDIDHRNSTITNKAKPLGLIVNILCGHRWIFHDPFVYTAIAFVCFFLFSQWQYLVIGLYAGIMSHLALDINTPLGIPVLGKRIRLLTIKSGGIAEHLLCLSMLFIAILLVVMQFLPMLKINSCFLEAAFT